VILLGAQCTGATGSTLWRSCNTGPWTELPSPVSVARSGDELPIPWPESFSGHAMAFVGAWRLVVVDAVRGTVWTFLDANLTAVAGAAAPMRRRLLPALAATGQGALLLLGGRACGDPSTGVDGCQSGQVLGDVWQSDDAGLSWRCLTVDAFAAVGGPRWRPALGTAHDGTVLVAGGWLGSTTGGSADVLESAPEGLPPEARLPAPQLVLQLPGPGAEGVLVFSRAVNVDQHSSTFGLLRSIGVSAGAGEEVPLTVNTSGPVVTFLVLGLLYPSTTYQFRVGSTFAGPSAPSVQPWTFRTASLDGSEAPAVSDPADVTPPLLSGFSPEPEAPHGSLHNWTTSQTLQLTFTEPVQSGTQGTVRFSPKSAAGRVVVVDPGGSGAHILGSRVALVPEGLLPGEAYEVLLEAGAFADLAGNPCPEANWSISFAHLWHFRRVSGVSGPLSLPGERYASAAAVDPANQFLLIGGKNGSTGGSLRLNDVWLLDTGRLVDCAAAYEHSSACSRTACSGEPPTLGSAVERRLVWRPPSLGGRRCVDAATGETRSGLGQEAGERSEVCPCPRCPGPPEAPLPALLANTADIPGYALAFADVEPKPLVCVNGFVSTGPFLCRAATRHFGAWASYPSCEPADCMLPPVIAHVAGGIAESQCQDCLGETAENCSAELPEPNLTDAPHLPTGLPHGAACSFRCLSGYTPSGPLQCLLGEYDGACLRRSCGMPPMFVGGNLSCDASSPLMESRCNLTCSPGFMLVGPGIVECNAANPGADGAPTWATNSSCARMSCGEPPVATNSFLGQITGTLLGQSASFGCGRGHQLALESDETLPCEVNVTTGLVAWKGAVICERRPCMAQPHAARGTFDCSPGDGRFNDSCQLSCPTGSSLGSENGTYICDGETYVGSGVCDLKLCERPTLPSDAVALASSCGSPVRHGDTCHVLCRSAYREVGAYRCTDGVYTERPACIFAGKTTVTMHAVQASVQAVLVGQLSVLASSSNTAELASLQGMVKAAIDLGLAVLDMGGLQATNVQVKLAGANNTARRLTGQELPVVASWQFNVPDVDRGRAAAQALMHGTSSHGFVVAFSTRLAQEDAGTGVQEVLMAQALPLLWYEREGDQVDTQSSDGVDFMQIFKIAMFAVAGFLFAIVVVAVWRLMCLRKSEMSQASKPASQGNGTNASEASSDTSSDCRIASV